MCVGGRGGGAWGVDCQEGGIVGDCQRGAERFKWPWEKESQRLHTNNRRMNNAGGRTAAVSR